MGGITTKEGWDQICEYRLPISFKFGVKYGFVPCPHKLFIGAIKDGVFVPIHPSFQPIRSKLFNKDKQRIKIIDSDDNKIKCLWYTDEMNFTRMNIYRREIKEINPSHDLRCSKCR